MAFRSSLLFKSIGYILLFFAFVAVGTLYITNFTLSVFGSLVLILVIGRIYRGQWAVSAESE